MLVRKSRNFVWSQYCCMYLMNEILFSSVNVDFRVTIGFQNVKKL